MKIGLILFIGLLISADKVDDREFNFRYSVSLVEEVNTFDNTFWRNYIKGVQTFKFRLTDKERHKILSVVSNSGLENWGKIQERDTCEDGRFKNPLPVVKHEFEFSFGHGTRKTYNWDNNKCKDSDIFKLEIMADSLKQIVLDNQEMKKIKKSDIRLM